MMPALSVFVVYWSSYLMIIPDIFTRYDYEMICSLAEKLNNGCRQEQRPQDRRQEGREEEDRWPLHQEGLVSHMCFFLNERLKLIPIFYVSFYFSSIMFQCYGSFTLSDSAVPITSLSLCQCWCFKTARSLTVSSLARNSRVGSSRRLDYTSTETQTWKIMRALIFTPFLFLGMTSKPPESSRSVRWARLWWTGRTHRLGVMSSS